MSTARTAIRARRKARLDERYKYKHRDAATAARRLQDTIDRERRMAAGKKKR